MSALTQEIVNTIYKSKQEFIIVGLTGRIGSGCSTAAKFLSQKTKEHNLKEICLTDHISDNKRKKYIIHKFYKKNWIQFKSISLSDIITLFIFQYSYRELENIIDKFNSKIEEYKKYKNEDPSLKRFKHFNKIKIKSIISKKKYKKYHDKFYKLLEDIQDSKSKDNYNILYKRIKKFFDASKKFKKHISDNNYKYYTDLYQLCGDNIRLYGDIEIKNTNPNSVYTIADTTNKIIKIIKKHNELKNKPTYIVLDALRNIMEMYYFKSRYSAFYMIAINADDKDIKNRLRKKSSNLTTENLENQLGKENNKLELNNIYDFSSQNIQTCIVNSDMFIYNKDSNILEMYGQLIKYISLIQHPGLVTPSQDEKMMQIAFTAKLNSACLSRQVGACVTNKDGSVKAIGWNSVANGQTPCLLRSSNELLKSNNLNISYSAYEKSKNFKTKIQNFSNTLDLHTLNKKGLNDSFCFKTIYTTNNEKEKNNQVHTRSLHAEENAFLQLAKYGSGESIIGGTLYSTASPCELCSKKSYQLGIKRIVYIDPYPGIAREQILNSGLYPPKIDLFNGVIGDSYYKLYTQMIPFKDELKCFNNSKEK